MKSKTPLALMELIIMILIFSLAAALCLKAFLWSDQMSVESAVRDQAVIQVQTVAETIKACSGDFARAAEILGVQPGANGQSLTIPGQDFVLTAEKRTTDTPYLGCAFLSAAPYFSLEIFWQEVTPDE